MTDSLGLTHAFWRETLIQAAIYREWVEISERANP
ncbi:hypothetical protein ACVWZZ_002263 [Bradyrhizobium sp. LM6.10]